jgi:hypothetical protein
VSAARATVPTKAPSAARPASRQLTAERETAQAGSAVATGWSFSSLAPTARAALGQAGRPLDAATRGTMETAFDADLSAVRVHDDARAAEAAADVHASAFTVGQDVVFGRGRYAPSTSAGRELLAHELAHTIQQRGARTAAAPVEAGSPLEERARAAATGRSVGSLGVSDLGLASAPASPDSFDDDELAQQIAKYAEKLKTPSYPGRSGDADWLARLRSAQKQRASVKETQAAPKKAYKPASHKQTPAQARRTAVIEAEAAAASIEAQLVQADVEEKEEPAPVSMALDEPGKKPKPKPAASAKPKRATPKKPPSKFTPGGFKDVDIYGETDAALKRMEEENAPAKDPRPFKERMAEANRKAPYTLLPADYPDSVWSYGISRGLFAEKERSLVYETLEAPRRERAHKELEHEKMMAEYHRQLQYENYLSDLNLAFIQGALLGGPRAPFLVQAGYAAYSGAETGRAIGQAIQTGDPVDIGSAVVPLAGGLALHGLTRGEPGAAPPEEPAAPPIELEEVTPEQVRALYKAEPFAVKKNLSGSFHQLVWESLGGQGQAPPFFRSGRVMQVFERLWPTDLAEINDPSELGPGGQLPPDPVATAPTLDDPRAPTQPAPAEQPAPQEPVAQPAGAGTMPSAPAAPLRPPRQGPPPAVEATVDDVADAMRADPQRVYRSPTSDWHDQIWMLSRGRGEIPPLFRSGRTYIVDVTRLTDAERAALGL